MLDYISHHTLILENQKKKKKNSIDCPTQHNIMKIIVPSNVNE